jgi:hypothetical protein
MSAAFGGVSGIAEQTEMRLGGGRSPIHDATPAFMSINGAIE